MRSTALLLAATLIVSVGRVDGDELGVLSDRGDIVSVGDLVWGHIYGHERTNSVREDTFVGVLTDTKNTEKCWEWDIIESAREHALYANSSLLQQCQEGTARQRKQLARRNATLTSVRTTLSRCRDENAVLVENCVHTCSDVHKTCQKIEQNNIALTHQLAAVNGQLATLGRENALHVANNTNLTRQLAAVNETLTTLRRENASHVENSTKLAEQLAAANKTLTTLRRENASHVANNKNLSEQLAAANGQLVTLFGDNAQLRKANAANVAKITKLENELAAARGQHEPKAELGWVEYVFFLMVNFTLISIIVTADDSTHLTHRLLNWFFIIPNFTSRTACGNSKLWQEATYRGFVLFFFVIGWMVCCMSTTEFYWCEHLILVVLIDLGWLWWKLGAVHPGANTRVKICDERENLVLYESTRSDKFLACFGQDTVRVSFFMSLLFKDLKPAYILFVLHVVLYVGKACWIRLRT